MSFDETRPHDPTLLFTTLRARTGLIFFGGLLLLIGATVAITIGFNNAAARDLEAIETLNQVGAQADAWAASLVSPDASTGMAPPAELEATLQTLLDGGLLLRPGGIPTRVGPERGTELAQPLEEALSVWHALRAEGNEPAGPAADPARLQRLAALRQELRAHLDRLLILLQVRQAANNGVIRGMYAAMLVSSLLFLLIGLWFTQQMLVAPLEALDRLAYRVAAGDLDTPVALGGPDEFSELAQSFERMRLELRSSRERLTRWTSDLQAHVARRTQELSALSEVIAAASRSLELSTVLNTGLEQSLQAVELEMGGIWLIDEDAGSLHLAADIGLPQAVRERARVLQVGQGATGRAAQSGQTIVLEDISTAPSAVMEVALREGLRSMAAVPIKLRDRVLGVLNVMTRRPRSFRPEEIALLTSIGQQIGIAVDSLRLAEEVRQGAERVAALQERERISIELHDGLLQTLSYLHLKADQLEAEASAHGLQVIAGELAAYRQVLERATHEARRFIADLRETPPRPVPLQAALRDMVRELAVNSSLEVTLQLDEPPLLLPPDQSAHLVRIAREALINAAQHGHARRAMVTYSRSDASCELSIRDDGEGFDLSRGLGDDREHFGLSVMQARAARVGGGLLVESAPGRGTCVKVVWQADDRGLDEPRRRGVVGEMSDHPDRQAEAVRWTHSE